MELTVLMEMGMVSTKKFRKIAFIGMLLGVFSEVQSPHGKSPGNRAFRRNYEKNIEALIKKRASEQVSSKKNQVLSAVQPSTQVAIGTALIGSSLYLFHTLFDRDYSAQDVSIVTAKLGAIALGGYTGASLIINEAVPYLFPSLKK